MAILSKIKASDNVTYNIRDDYSTWGGRNWLGLSHGEFTGTVPASGNLDFKSWNSVVTVNPNEIWTLSFDAKSSIEGTLMWVFFYKDGSNITQVSLGITSTGDTITRQDGGYQFPLTTSYARYWVTYTFSNATASPKSVICGRLSAGTNNGATATVKNVKLEKGSKPTDWSPALEDIARDIGNETIELFNL